MSADTAAASVAEPTGRVDHNHVINMVVAMSALPRRGDDLWRSK
jgi:hypothetical protein